MWWQTIAWLIGFILGWLLSWLPAPARAGGFDDVAVRVVNQRGPIADIGSGTLVAGDGRTALVITCKHIFAEGRGVLTVERTNHTRYPARLLGTSRFNDISALEIPDPGVRPLRIADRQPRSATLIGFGQTNRAWKHRGNIIEHAGRTVFYSFMPLEGDSGGGVFDDAGRLAGVVWGTDGTEGAVVPLADLRAALAGPACSRYFRQTSYAKAGNPMLTTPMMLAAMMTGQLPPMPDKSPPAQQLPAPPAKTLPSPQTRATPQATPMPAFVPAQQYEAAPQYELAQAPQAFDIPITFRVRIRPQIDVQADAYASAPRAQVYAPQPQAITYGGGGCYGGSYSAGSYGLNVASYAAPAAAVICPSGACYGGGLSVGGFGLASRPFGRKIKIKEGPGIGLGPRGLRELLGR
jgi:hypothetical protein